MLYRILMWLCIVWLVPLMDYIFKNNAKFKKNIAVGVTFREEGKSDSDVLARLDKYKKQVSLVSLLLLIAVIPGLFIAKMWILLTYWLIWTDLVIFVYAVPYYFCNRNLRKIKSEKGWTYIGSDTVTLDTDNIPKFRLLSLVHFIIPCAVSLLPLIWDRTLWTVHIILALSVFIFWLIYRYLYRYRSETVNDEKELTAVLTRIRHYNWSKIWLISAWVTAMLSFVTLLFLNYPTISLILVFAISIGLCLIAVTIEIKIRKMQEKLTRGSGTDGMVDEDDKWLWGMIYYNPNDSKLLVNERVGMNVTVNLAHTAGKVIMGFMLILLIALPFTGPAMYIYYEKPIDIQVNAKEISVSQGLTHYQIKPEDIASVEMINKLPEDLIRVNGTSFENILKGNFRSGKENMKLLLRTDNPPFMKITKKNGEIFIFGFKGEAEEVEKLWRVD